MRRLVLPAAALLAALGLGQTPAPPNPSPALASTVVFPKPERIRYDDRCLYIDGQPLFVFSGAFQYFRCPKGLWKERFARMKEAGLNCVETYLPWSYHEHDEPAGPEDFSKLQHMDDITDFIQMARDMGLYVIVRPGPYICAEWDRGGLPEWLLKGKPEDYTGGYLRSSRPEILRWDKHWYDAVAKIIKPHLVTNLRKGSPGVILWQLENEFDLSTITPGEQAKVLHALAQDALDDGIDVPLFGCRTKASNADGFLRSHMFDSSTCYPGYDAAWLVKRINDIAQPQPEKLRAIPELQGGWFAQVGGKLSDQQGYNAAQLNQVGIVSIEQGCTLINYYMFVGGSQFGYGAAQNLIQSYDYDAPVRECGGVGDRYLAAKAIGLMLKEVGPELARAKLIPVDVSGVPDKDVHIAFRKADNGARFFFVRSDSKDLPRKGTASVLPLTATDEELKLPYDLPPFGAKIYYIPAGGAATKGQWMPKPVAPPARPDAAPSPIAVTNLRMIPDEPLHLAPAKMGQSFASLGINDTRYVTFTSQFNLTEAQAVEPPALLGQADAGALLFVVNGQWVPPETSATGLVDLRSYAHSGDNQVLVIYENNGNLHHTAALDIDKTVPYLSLVRPGANAQLVDWRMKVVPLAFAGPGNRPEVAADVDTTNWQKVSVAGGPNIDTENTAAVFRTKLYVTPEQLKAGGTLALGILDDTGEVFVNGQRVGGNTMERAKAFNVDISKYLKEGDNSIAVAVVNKDQVGGLFEGAYIVPTGVPLGGISYTTESVRGKIATEPDAVAGTPLTAGAQGPSPKYLSWVVMNFPTPETQAGVWVPWQLHLEASLNGYVYFNGHNLGAYWAAGPQTDIYLPECWFNTAGKNTIAIQARPTTVGGALVKQVQVRPMREFAEKR